MKRIEDPAIVVDADGTLITATGVGDKNSVVFRSENAELVSRAKHAADSGKPTEILYKAKPVNAGWDSLMSILAALMATVPGRCYIISAPDEVLQGIQDLNDAPSGAIV